MQRVRGETTTHLLAYNRKTKAIKSGFHHTKNTGIQQETDFSSMEIGENSDDHIIVRVKKALEVRKVAQMGERILTAYILL